VIGLIGKKLEKKLITVNRKNLKLKRKRKMMSNEKLIEFLNDKFLKDFNNNLILENKFSENLKNMERMGLANTKEYKRLVGIKTSQSYFVAYLYRLIEFYGIEKENLLDNFSPTNFRIKGKIQLWKKTDFRNIRLMRKDIGNDGVKLMKDSVEKTISKFNLYIENIYKNLKDL